MKNNKPDSNDPNEPMLLDHDADGIQELDNLLPRWWVWMFYICVAFSIGYMAYYHVLKLGDLQIAEYEKEMKVGDEIKLAAVARFESSLDSLEPSNDQAALGRGTEIYMNSCAPCHRADGGGLVGPNLTDDFWLHGDSFADSLRVIWNGVPDKGMVMWKGVLKPEEIHAVASYIYTMRGSNPANAKPPENQAPADTGPSEFE
ncbi:MAG: cbb3-type cytochrome c oxidase N-terminal domain-containing protein [Limisphaerales bacterium]